MACAYLRAVEASECLKLFDWDDVGVLAFHDLLCLLQVCARVCCSVCVCVCTGCFGRIGIRPPRIGTRGSCLTPNNGKNDYFQNTMLTHFGPIPGRAPQQSQNKSLKPPNSGCFDRIGTRHVIKKNTHQDQNFAFFGPFWG